MPLEIISIIIKLRETKSLTILQKKLLIKFILNFQGTKRHFVLKEKVACSEVQEAVQDSIALS